MSQIMKNLKLACIACLFIGLVTIVVGIVTGVRTLFDLDAIATLACGMGTVPAGAQSSRLANVPSNASKVQGISLIVIVADIIYAAIAYFAGDPTSFQIGAFVLVGIAGLLMLVFSHQEVKKLEQV